MKISGERCTAFCALTRPRPRLIHPDMAPHDQISSRNPRVRRALPWILAWAVLTSGGFAIHWLEWLDGSRGVEGAIGEHAAVKVTSNIQQIVTMPAWAVMNVVRFKWGVDSPWWSLLTLAIGWGTAVYVVNGIVRMRRRVLDGAGLKMFPGAARAEAPVARARDGGIDLSRRRVLFDAALGGASLAAGAAIVRGIITEPWDLVVRRYTIPLPNLPRMLEGYRIVQISDTHLGPRIPASYVRTAVEEALSLKPDMVALTGDYVHMGLKYVDLAAELFAPLAQGPRAVPVVGTLGNHDWWADGPTVSRAMSRVGVTMIDNARAYLRASDRAIVRDEPAPGDALCIAGLGDLRENVIDPWGTLGPVAPDTARIVLAHNPDTAEELVIARRVPPRIDLMLSGHTHGGQVHLPVIGTPGSWVPSRYGARYAGGLVQGPHCRVLVSRGVGMSIFPVRLGVPPELVEITLSRA